MHLPLHRPLSLLTLLTSFTNALVIPRSSRANSAPREGKELEEASRSKGVELWNQLHGARHSTDVDRNHILQSVRASYNIETEPGRPMNRVSQGLSAGMQDLFVRDAQTYKVTAKRIPNSEPEYYHISLKKGIIFDSLVHSSDGSWSNLIMGLLLLSTPAQSELGLKYIVNPSVNEQDNPGTYSILHTNSFNRGDRTERLSWRKWTYDDETTRDNFLSLLGTLGDVVNFLTRWDEKKTIIAFHTIFSEFNSCMILATEVGNL